jgi:hypothetical protein
LRRLSSPKAGSGRQEISFRLKPAACEQTKHLDVGSQAAETESGRGLRTNQPPEGGHGKKTRSVKNSKAKTERQKLKGRQGGASGRPEKRTKPKQTSGVVRQKKRPEIRGICAQDQK